MEATDSPEPGFSAETSRPQRAGDAFGEAMADCWAAGGHSGAALVVVERDDGYVSAMDASQYFAGRAEWPLADRRACARVVGRVLDAGCGAGRHAAVLGAAGHEVVGIDTSPGAVAVARERNVDARLGSAAHPPAGLGTFDTILLLGNNLALLESPHQAPTVLRSLADLTAPGGQLLGTCQDPHRATGVEHRDYGDWNLRRGRLPGQLRLRVRYRFSATEWFDYLLQSPEELATLCSGTPWLLANTEYAEDGTYSARLVLRAA